MATGALVAICLRCDWRGDEPSDRAGCPRCRAPLYRPSPPPSRPPQPHRPARPPEPTPPRSTTASSALIVDPPGPEHPRAAPSSGRRWWAGFAIVAAALLGAAALAPRGADDPSAAAAPGSRRTGPAQAVSQPVEVPEALRRALPGETHLTFSTVEQIPGLRDPLFRLWRLTLPDGRVRPGPVAGPLQVLRPDPDPDADRLAMVEGDGEVLLLEGFAGSRLHRIGRDAHDLDILEDGSIVASSVTYRTARCCGGTETVVQLVRIRPGSSTRFERSAWGLRSLTIQGTAVRGTTAYVWGIQGGGYHLVQLDLEGRRRIERPLGGLRPIGVDPRGRLIVVPDGALGRLPSPRIDDDWAVRWEPAIRLRQILGWSPDGRLAALGSWRGREAVWILRLDRRRPLFGARAISPLGTAAFLPGGRLLAWTEPGAIAVADPEGNAVHRLEMPAGFPEVLDPLAVG